MIFIETPIFTDDWNDEGLDDEQLRALQHEILQGKGDRMPGTGGFKKIRLARKGGGKSGGYRVIYYLQTTDICFLLFLYAKNRQVNLTPKQAKALKKLIE
ncbi:MAG: type II toxin-antitoxin system RelE/ParE family toxin [Verrucomicrobiota bacterium JB024]|nr:type II toxin-antitoxin system RelE/ParE family toxin [Verrucomicrobiota bacterium JB024]